MFWETLNWTNVELSVKTLWSSCVQHHFYHYKIRKGQRVRGVTSRWQGWDRKSQKQQEKYRLHGSPADFQWGQAAGMWWFCLLLTTDNTLTCLSYTLRFSPMRGVKVSDSPRSRFALDKEISTVWDRVVFVGAEHMGGHRGGAWDSG